MKRPEHIAISSGRMTPRRALSIGLVGAIHVAVIWALLNGIAVRIKNYIPPTLIAHVVNIQQPEQKVAPPPTSFVKPTEPQIAPPPVIDIQTPPPPAAISTPPRQPATNTVPVNASASGIASTHTTPPYPPNARRLGEQGEVRLKITVTPQGTVGDAQVEQSSGHPDLDQTAMDWVKSHWRYKPAMQNGVAIASTTEAIVKFDLKTAH